MPSILNLSLIFLVLALSWQAQGFEDYQVDTKPLRDFEPLSSEYEKLHQKFQTQPLTISEHERRVEILDYVLERQPNWLDGYWLHGSESFILASSFPDEKDYPRAKSYLNAGLEKVQTCLEQDRGHMLCKFFLGSLLAKLSSIEGIFASLKHGKTIRDSFHEVTKAEYNLKFRPNVSLQGSAFYGLGLFYRLVPDVFLIDWIWGIRGNLEKSIALHKTASQFDEYNPCSLLMLAVAQLCVHHEDESHPEFQSAMINLQRAQKIRPIDTPQEVCIQETFKIQDNPSRTCGYTQAKYADQNEEN